MEDKFDHVINGVKSGTNTAVSNLGDLYAVADKKTARADKLQQVYDQLVAIHEEDIG